MGPKKDSNKSNPEKDAKLKENWADKLPLKYPDLTNADRNDITFFAQNFASNARIVGNNTAVQADLEQIFDMYCLMALNTLKTANDVNEATKLAAGKNKSQAKENATMSNSF